MSMAAKSASIAESSETNKVLIAGVQSVQNSQIADGETTFWTNLPSYWWKLPPFSNFYRTSVRTLQKIVISSKSFVNLVRMMSFKNNWCSQFHVRWCGEFMQRINKTICRSQEANLQSLMHEKSREFTKLYVGVNFWNWMLEQCC